MSSIVTAEPVAFLYYLTSYMLMTGVQDLIYTKACFTKYPIKICNSLYDIENEAALNAVQSSSAHWILGWSLLLSAPSIISAQFIGSWSDTFGTKIPMLIPPTGMLFASLIYIGMSVYLIESPMFLLLVASVIAGVCGGYMSCILTCLNFISKITNSKDRTFRVGLIEGAIFTAGCIGPLLTGWIQSTFGRSYIYVTIAALQALNVVYIVANIEDIVPRQQGEECSKRRAFTFDHLWESLSTIFRFRCENRRLYIFLLVAALAICEMCLAADISVSYIYLKDNPIQLKFSSFALYVSIKHGIGAFSIMGILPFLRKLPDTILLMMGLLSYVFGYILLGLAKNSAMVYSVTVVLILSSWCKPVIRSALSKLLETHEQGKLFASLAMVEGIFMLAGSALFTGLYPLTRQHFHGFVFILSAALLVIPFGVALFLHKKLLNLVPYSSMPDVISKMEDDLQDDSVLSSSSSITSQLTVSDETLPCT